MKNKEHDWKNSLDIFNIHPGDKVAVIAKDGEVWNGYDSDKRHVEKHLKIGIVYTISRINIQDWKTDIYLEEVPEIPFNSCNLYSV
jgi:hypothetical protein